MNNEIEKFCKECGNSFITRNYRKEFCSGACKTKNSKKNNKKEYFHTCTWCKKEFISNSKKTKYCSLSCSAKGKMFNFTGYYFCKECGVSFKQKHSRNYFCSAECKSKYGTKNQTKVSVNCSNCDKPILVLKTRINKQNNFYCSKLCESQHRSSLSDDTRICEYCKNIFSCKKGQKQRFCSMTCQSQWQKTITGKDHPTYNHEISDEQRKKSCECCGKEMVGTPKEFELKKYCSKKCLLSSNKQSLTKPHLLVIEMLDEIGIEYEIEKKILEYFFDCYIPIKKLVIEVMGDYWHCNIEKYIEPVDGIQEKGIIKDKKKNKQTVSQGYFILYLWEKDINANYEMCKKLIEKFIKSNGMLINYHSSNYVLEKENIVLKNSIIEQHLEK